MSCTDGSPVGGGQFHGFCQYPKSFYEDFGMGNGHGEGSFYPQTSHDPGTVQENLAFRRKSMAGVTSQACPLIQLPDGGGVRPTGIGFSEACRSDGIAAAQELSVSSSSGSVDFGEVKEDDQCVLYPWMTKTQSASCGKCFNSLRSSLIRCLH